MCEKADMQRAHSEWQRQGADVGHIPSTPCSLLSNTGANRVDTHRFKYDFQTKSEVQKLKDMPLFAYRCLLVNRSSSQRLTVKRNEHSVVL